MIEDVLNKISVKPPYFALSNMVMANNETLSAQIPVEQNMGSECGVISAAEAGRHMAILGSCALALKNSNPTRHYYLAVEAKVKKISNLFESAILFGKANVVSLTKRSGIVFTKLLTETGQLLYTIEVSYKILHHNLFEKLFKQNKYINPIIPTFNNPYLNEIPLSKSVFEDDKLKTVLGPLKPHECQGHFPEFPAVPVAILMHSMSKAAGLLFSHKFGKKNLAYIVEEGLIKADNLAFAGNKINIIISYSKNEHFNFKCRALSDKGIEYGAMELALQPMVKEIVFPKLITSNIKINQVCEKIK